MNMDAVKRLLDIMATLRDPQNGCPWDVAQTFSTIAPYTLEEAYEVADAIERGALDELRDELGDLLFQVVFHARMAEEQDLFDFSDVAEAIVAKLLRRHPHVFGNAEVRSAAEQTQRWEEQKARERAEKNAGGSALDGMSVALPAMVRAVKLQRRAARVGFDWTELGPVMDKLEEELHEVRAELDARDPQRLEHEIGDLLFSCANLARHLGVDPEGALRSANARFERRFRHMETAAGESGESLQELSPGRLDALWRNAKAAEDGA